jgi:hypothetical protein
MRPFAYLLITAISTIVSCQSQLGFTCPVIDVSSLKVSNITSTTALLTWKEAAHATSYFIHFHEKADTTNIAWKDIEVQAATSFKLFSLKPNTLYQYTLETVCGSSGLNNSGYSKPFQEFTTTP